MRQRAARAGNGQRECTLRSGRWMLGEDVEAGCSGTSYRRRGNWKLTRTRKQAGDGKIHSPIESIQSLNCDVIKLAAASLPCGKSWAYGNGEIRQCYGRGWWRRW